MNNTHAMHTDNMDHPSMMMYMMHMWFYQDNKVVFLWKEFESTNVSDLLHENTKLWCKYHYYSSNAKSLYES